MKEIKRKYFYSVPAVGFVFAKDILLECPKCKGKAVSKPQFQDGNITNRVLSCTQCSYFAKSGEVWYGPKNIVSSSMHKFARDADFGLNLWLRENIKNDILWAYNLDHVLWLKDYVSSNLRERKKYGATLKLPKFISLAKNRDLILKALKKMEMK